MVPSCRARISAGSSATVPRPMLMKMPLGPSAFSTAASIRFRVDAVPGSTEMSRSTSFAISMRSA